MIKAFKIYKKGTTVNGFITILCPENEFNQTWLNYKINFYTYLGYTIELI